MQNTKIFFIEKSVAILNISIIYNYMYVIIISGEDTNCKMSEIASDKWRRQLAIQSEDMPESPTGGERRKDHRYAGKIII